MIKAVVPKAIPEKQGLKLVYNSSGYTVTISPKGHSRKTRIETLHCDPTASHYLKSQRPFQKNKD